MSSSSTGPLPAGEPVGPPDTALTPSITAERCDGVAARQSEQSARRIGVANPGPAFWAAPPEPSEPRQPPSARLDTTAARPSARPTWARAAW